MDDFVKEFWRQKRANDGAVPDRVNVDGRSFVASRIALSYFRKCFGSDICRVYVLKSTNPEHAFTENNGVTVSMDISGEEVYIFTMSQRLIRIACSEWGTISAIEPPTGVDRG